MESSYCLLYDAVSTSHYRELSSKFNTELKHAKDFERSPSRCQAIFRHSPVDAELNPQNFSQDSRCLSQHSNRGLSEYMSGTFPLTRTCKIVIIMHGAIPPLRIRLRSVINN
jgi:hypothetical protein